MKKKLQFLFSLAVMMLVATVARAQIYIETDLTSQFAALTSPGKWSAYNGGNVAEVGWASPKVLVSGGIGEKAPCEYYHAPGCDFTGDVLYQTVTGLAPGTYTIELYGAAAFTFGRGFGSEAFTGDLTKAESDTYKEGDKIEPSDEVKTGVTLYAESEGTTYGGEIPIWYATNFNPDGPSTVTLTGVVVGSSGQIKIGMNKTSKSTNWHVIQLKSVIATVDAEVLLSNAITAANAALEDAQYAAITGDERTALSTAISENSSPEATGTAYEAAANAINAAVTTFTNALDSYKAYADAKALVNLEAWPYADAAKKSAVEDAMSVDPTSAEDATTKAAALLKAYRQYVESNAAAASVEGAVDMTDLITNATSASVDGWSVVKGEGSGGNVDIKSNEPWTDGSDNATHSYFDGGNWGASAWDVSFVQEVNLEPGKYMLTAIARASSDVTFTLFAGESEAAIPAVGATGGLFTRGWNDQFVEFEVAEAGAVKIGVKGVTNVIHNWMSFSNFRLVQLEAPKVIEGYDLTADMYHKWTSPEADAEIANPDNPGRGVRLNEETDCPYGNTNVVGDEYADLTDWDQLIMVLGSADQPRLFFNDSETNGGRITVLTNDANYVVSNVDGVITYDLTKIKEARGFVHLNAIKASSWNTKANVTALKLIGAPKYGITIAAGIENGTVGVKGGLTKAAAGEEVTLVAIPVENFELDAFAVTYNDGVDDLTAEVSEGGVFVMPAFPVTVSATFKEAAAPAPALSYTDLTQDMFFQWDAWVDGNATNQAGCAYELNTASSMPYGDGSVNNYADLTGYSTLELTATAGSPRFLFNRDADGGQWNEDEAASHLIDNTRGGWSAKYFSSRDNGDGTTTYIVDIAALVADKGYAHLHSIKASGSVTATDMKLGYEGAKPGLPLNSITIADDIEGGSVAVSGNVKVAKPNAEITLTNTPNPTFEFVAYSVTYNDGTEDKEVEVSAEGVFTMPAFPVTVSATFNQTDTPADLEDWFTNNVIVAKDYSDPATKVSDYPDGSAFPEPNWKADEKGNGYAEVVSNANRTNPWDSQIFIEIPEEFRGKKVAILMKVRASKAVKADGQLHTSNDGKGWTPTAAPSVDFVVGKWTNVAAMLDLTSNSSLNNFVLNLTQDATSPITYGFDDIRFDEFKADWYYAQEIRAKDYVDPSATYTDTDTPHPLANFVADEEGGYVQVISNANPSQTYNSQIWIQIPDEWVGKSTKMTYEVMANQVVSAPESYQATATGKGWGANGSPNNGAKLEIKEADKWITITRILNTEGVKSNGGAPYPSRQVDQYCLDLSNNAEPITYKFRNIKFERAAEDWYAENTIVYKDPDFKDSETGSYYEDGKTYEFPAAVYVYGEPGDERGGYVEVKSKATPDNAWASQIFFSIPSSLVGKAVNITMDVKASQEVTADGQLHNSNDGGGYTNAAAPKMPFTTEWATQTVKVEPTTQNTYVLNLAYAADPITYYFDNLAFELAPVDYQEPNLEDTEQWYQDLAAQGITILSRGEPAFTDGTPDKNARYITGSEPGVGDYLEYVAKSGVSNTWESQVFIYLVDDKEKTLPAGTEITVSMKVKASENHKAGSQAQQGPGGYLGGGIPEISFTTEWQPYNGSFTVPASGNSAKTNCFSLDLGNSGSSTITYYFDEVVVTVTPPTLEEDLTWTENLLTNGNFEGNDMSEFVAKIQLGHNEVVDGQPTGNYIYEEMDPEILQAEKTDLAKNAVNPDEPNGLFLKVAKYAPDPADETKLKGNSWDSQLWVRLPYTLPAGTYYVFDFDYKTSNSAYAIETQTHGDPGSYINSDAMGNVTPAGTDWEHFHFFGKSTADLSSICLNLASENGGNYRFDNFSFKVQPTDLEGEAATIPAATQTFAENTLWLSHTKPLNEKIHEGKQYNNDEGQYTEESFKALTDAIAAAKAVLADNNKKNDKEALATALTDVQNAIDGLEAPEQLLPAPETDPDYADFVEIPLDQQDVESGDVHLAPMEDKGSYTKFTTTDGICVVFKMKNIDVTDCDYITIKFAKPAPAGQAYAVWTGNANKGIDEGASEVKYVFASDPNCKIQNGILPEVSIISIYTGAGKDVSVYGVYKHKAAVEPETAALDDEMYHLWTGIDAEAEIADPDNNTGVYNLGNDTGCVYGNSDIKIATSNQYADLSDWDYLTIVVASADQPRLFFNQNDQQDNGGNIVVMANNADYVVSNENGVIVYDLAKFKADHGYVHLNAIKASRYDTQTNVTEMMLANGAPYEPVVTAINAVGEEDNTTVKDGKYFINGQIVIVKNGVKYNAAGVAIE